MGLSSAATGSLLVGRLEFARKIDERCDRRSAHDELLWPGSIAEIPLGDFDRTA